MIGGLDAYGAHAQFGFGQTLDASDFGKFAVYQDASMAAWAGMHSPSVTAAWGHAFAPPQAPVYDPFDSLRHEVGLDPSEHQALGWIVEAGLDPEALPAHWRVLTDAGSGRLYYVDEVSQSSSWDNPLTPSLRAVAEIARGYLETPTKYWLQAQSSSLWDSHMRDLERWHGPLTNGEGQQYFVNSHGGSTCLRDPREDTQHMWELETHLLDVMDAQLAPFLPDDAPNFGSVGEQPETAGFACEQPQMIGDAEVLNLDAPDSPAPLPLSPGQQMSPQWASRAERDAAERAEAERAAADAVVRRGRSEQKTTFDFLWKSFEEFQFWANDDEEAQCLKIARKARERLKRRQALGEEERCRLREARAREDARVRAVRDAEKAQQAEIKRRQEEVLERARAEAAAAKKERERKRLEEMAKESLKKRAAKLAEEKRLAEESKRRAEEADRRRREEAERQQKLEQEEVARHRQERRRTFLARLQEAMEGREVSKLQSIIDEGEADGWDQELQAAKEILKHSAFRARMQEAIEKRDITLLEAVIAEGDADGQETDLEPARTALQQERERRRAVAKEARAEAATLVSQFKDAVDAQKFGGAVLAAQWRAAFALVNKPEDLD